MELVTASVDAALVARAAYRTARVDGCYAVGDVVRYAISIEELDGAVDGEELLERLGALGPGLGPCEAPDVARVAHA